jgi:hypothetical protein
MRCLILLRGYNQGAYLVCRTLRPAPVFHCTFPCLLAVCRHILSARVCTSSNKMGDEGSGWLFAAHEQAASGGWDVCAATKDSYDFKHRVGSGMCLYEMQLENLMVHCVAREHCTVMFALYGVHLNLRTAMQVVGTVGGGAPCTDTAALHGKFFTVPVHGEVCSSGRPLCCLLSGIMNDVNCRQHRRRVHAPRAEGAMHSFFVPGSGGGKWSCTWCPACEVGCRFAVA